MSAGVAKQRVEALLEANDSSAVIELPLDIPGLYGEKRPPIRGTINGTPFQSRIAVYGGRYYLGINRSLREAAGVKPGDRVVVELERDEEPRTVTVPEDLAQALAEDSELRAYFDGLSYTHRKEYVSWITEAKRTETRRRRITKALEMLRDGLEHP
jgi:Bacteriocin-protection, YdeI or OmpD-Associated/Domain of unknown function (DUF1905)